MTVDPKIQDTEESFVEDVLKKEKTRYQRKGYGIIIGFFLTVGYFFFFPKLLEYFWPEIPEERQGAYFFYYAIASHVSSFLFINLFFYVIYKLELDYFERYKVNNMPWPWKSDPAKWRVQLRKSILLISFNALVIAPILSLPSLFGKAPFRMENKNFDSYFEMAWQLIFMMLIEDITFYWSHRFLHFDFIYPYLHKEHHVYKNSISISGEHSHPIDYMFSSLLPSNLGALILGNRIHAITHTVWMVFRVAESADGHCGYDFSWSPFRFIPFSAGSEFHNYHHSNFKGNYGSFFTFWDTICGTVNDSYKKFLKKKIKGE
jgi:sterol desaturase/sphingolipid hydroxylase (fatty acid hydroxylase superfamily)